jgi:hypothetical protein
MLLLYIIILAGAGYPSHEQAQRRPGQFHISITAKEKKRIEQQKVERFVSRAACRRVHLDREIDGRIDRVRCEDG